MKRLLIYLIPILSLLSSCKVDTDSLAGFWQLTEWRDSQGRVQQPDGRIYYAIQLSLIKFQAFDSDIEGKYDSNFSHFSHKGGEIILLDAFESHGGGLRDERLPDFSQLARFGVPADGRFKIKTFDDDRLVLETQDGKLSFRRY